MRQSFAKLIFTALFFCFSSLAYSQSETIFSSNEILNLRIEGSWAELLKQRYLAPEIAKRYRLPVTVVIINKDKTETLINAEAGLRGNTSLSPMECAFPKFKLYFSEASVSGTILSGREQLSVGSHCSYRGGNSALYGRSYDGKAPHREALIYRLLEILQIDSFKTRPLMVQYIDPEFAQGPVQAQWHQAFIFESKKQLALRLGLEMIDEDSANQVDLGDEGSTDVQKLARIVLFNEMIENYDWKINLHELPGLRQTWNTLLAKNSEGNTEVIPYDFDLSGAVTILEAKTISSSENLRKLPPQEMAAAKDFYRSKRFALDEEIKSIKKLDPAGWQVLKKKLDLFFEIKIKP